MSRWFVLGTVLLGAVLFGSGCGPQPDYAYCSSNAGCTSGICANVRVRTTTGAFMSGHQCTRECVSSSECRDRNGMGAACLMIADTFSGFYCYQGCTFDIDCPGTGVCTPVTGGAVGSVCFPSD